MIKRRSRDTRVAGEAAMHRRHALKVFAGLVLCPLCASAGFAAEEGHHWSYEGASGPDKWGGLEATEVLSLSLHRDR